MSPEEAEAKVLAALAVVLAPGHGVGSAPTARLLDAARDSFEVPEKEALLALDRLAERGRIVERDGSWSPRPAGAALQPR